MSQMHVVGAFKTVQGAQLAADRLINEGIPREAVGVVMSDKARQRLATVETHTKGAEGVATGGVTGGVLGGIVAGLTTVAAVALPGVGVLAAGPIVSILAGAGAGAAAGGALGGLVGLGMSEHEVKYYGDVLKSEGVLVTVTTADKQMQKHSRKVLDDAGAIAVQTTKGAMAQL